MKKFNVILNDDQIESINKVLAFEDLSAADLVSYEIIQMSDVMVLTISRLAWLYSSRLERIELSCILDLLDDIIHYSCSKSARSKSKKLIDNH